ncbi:MAG: hypothetical protein ACLR2O_05840 [Coprococcus sp.]
MNDTAPARQGHAVNILRLEHYTRICPKNPEWEFAGIYMLMMVSPAPTPRTVEEFNRMIEDCKAGNHRYDYHQSQSADLPEIGFGLPEIHQTAQG